MKNKEYYERNLPHIQPKGALFFVTWTLKGAIPEEKREILKNEYTKLKTKIKDKQILDKQSRIFFKKYDDILDNDQNEIQYLKDTKLSKIVADTIHFWDGKKMNLIAYCIMSNHVHVVLKMYAEDKNGKELYLHDILESIKKHSARECNKIIGNTGNSFWQHESYDRKIRDKEELQRIIAYTLENPVKAGLCEKWSDWEFSYKLGN